MSKEIYYKINKDKYTWAVEEEVRKDWLKHLENELNIRFHAERDRNDAHYNQVIIEFKNKGAFNGSIDSSKFKEAIYERLQPYIIERAKKEGLNQSEYTGIATDGEHVVFAYVKNDKIIHGDLMPFSEESILKIVLVLKNSNRRAFIVDNLIEDFGHMSSVGKLLMSELSLEIENHFNKSGNNKIKMLFEEWKTLYGQVADLSSVQKGKIIKTLNFSLPNMGIDSISGVLFVIHTYNAIVIKLLGAEIISYYGLTQFKDFCEFAATQPYKKLEKILREDIERSKLFKNVGITGFVEEAIFSWYLDVSSEGQEKILDAIKGVLLQLSLYKIDDLNFDSSQDVLRGFYQSLVPEVLRKTMGEFYTPAWLIDVTLDKTDTEDWLKVRMLDPTCGSGSFLLKAINRKRRVAEVAGYSEEETVDHIIENVWGFDLNPLAVQTARVNYLIAIADLFARCGAKTIEIPVLLADAVYSPSATIEASTNTVEYKVGSNHANLVIKLPEKLAFNREKLDSIFNIMEKSVDESYEYNNVEAKLLRKKIITKYEAKQWRKDLETTYKQVLVLHKKDWNGIWFRIVRNFFWSATAGKFNLIVGNPPWVRWSNLPSDYREKIKPTCQSYEIFSRNPYHGGNELDISGMITYTVADKWLDDQGKLVFVITQSHFQAPSSEGFRSFKIDESYSLIPLHVDDLKEFKIFPGVTNKTSIASFIKDKNTQIDYPVDYYVWESKKGFSKTLPEYENKDNILERVIINKEEANPVDEKNSPWAIMSPGNFNKVSKIRGESKKLKGRKGVTTDLNGIFMVKILDVDEKRRKVKIKTRPEAGRIDIGKPKTYWVEPDLLYPLMKGAGDFSICDIHIKDDLYIFVPNKGIRKEELLMAKDLIEKSNLASTLNYFQDFEEVLANRSTYKARLSNYPFYMIYNVGDYTFSPYKVVWAEQSKKFKAAVISGKEMPVMGFRPYVPDHKIYYLDCYEEDIAYYFAGLLTTSLVREYIESHTIKIQISNIFKHLILPMYDDTDGNKKRISELTKEAHFVSNKKRKKDIIIDINRLGEKIIQDM